MTTGEVGSRGERGVALIVALLCMLLMTALGSALILVTITETGIASTYARGLEALHAADAALAYVALELSAVDDWNSVLNGTAASAFSDGPASGTRTVSGESAVDLSAATNLLRCGKRSPCSDPEIEASTHDRPWGVDNPRWQLYAYGPVGRLLQPAAFTSPFYVLVWVGDDPAEHDGRSLEDGAPNVDGSVNAGRGVVAVLAQAYGAQGTTRRVWAEVSRAGRGIRVARWRELH